MMFHSLSINLFLLQCLSIYSLDQDSPAVDDKMVRRVKQMEGSTSVHIPVSYNCEFINKWTEERHPAKFPNGENCPNLFCEHWSAPLIASHNKGYTMWAEGIKATLGVKNVAEIGNNSELEKELGEAGKKVRDHGTASEDFFPGDSQSISITDKLEMDRGHTLISAISMLAPSSDWFSGLDSYRPVKDGKWMQSFTMTGYAYDAGTKNGIEYSYENPATDPQETITQFTKENVLSNGILLNPAGNDVLPVAQWSCTLNELTCEESEGARFFRRKVKDENGVKTVQRQKCKWLAKREQDVIDKFCDRSSPSRKIPSASEVCRVTCGTCVK